MIFIFFSFRNKIRIHFDKGSPVTPFQQLMSVLPPRSQNLVPPVFRSLMIDEQSEVKQFYPEVFDVDMEEAHVRK